MIGHKIGLTSRAMQQASKMTEPGVVQNQVTLFRMAIG